MRKIILILAVVIVFASPTWATVNLTYAAWSDEITVHFDASGESNLVRAFALDITVDSGAKIVDVIPLDPKYNIYPGSIDINDATGDVDDYGSAACDPGYAGTLGGLGTSGVSVEMASLYFPPGDGSPNAPGTSGDLFTIVVDNDCNVTIVENAIRGGVILTDGADASISASVYNHVGCLPKAASYYATWVAMGQLGKTGRPGCWCFARQCYGDADGDDEGGFITGYWYVGIPDLDIMSGAWLVKEPGKGPGIASVPNGICADFDHDDEGGFITGYWRVGIPDLDIMSGTWLVKEPPKGPGIGSDCGGSLLPKP